MNVLDPEKDIFFANVIYEEGMICLRYNSKLYYYQLVDPSFELEETDMERYSALYPWSNEILSSYYNYENLNNKTVLCTTGSGSHIIHAALAGSNNITAFDINPLAKWYAALQIALIKTYDYKNYIKQFDMHSIKIAFNKKYKLPCIKKDIDLDSLSDNLSNEEMYFWKKVLEGKLKNTFNLFRCDGFVLPLREICAYYNKNNYNKAKERLLNTNISYFDLDITNEEEIKMLATYDTIFVSNILEYYNYKSEETLTLWSKLLNENGVLYVYYCRENPRYVTCDGLKIEKEILSPSNKVYKCSTPGVLVYKKRS